MQAVVQQTGVPPDTLRSWERRHGFPAPSRTDSNRRLYSERDITAIAWVRDQTERGQGTQEAIAMLQRQLAGARTAAPQAAPPAPATAPSENGGDLLDALLDADLARAQEAWDRLARAVSVESLCVDVMLPAHRALIETEGAGKITRPSLLRAIAFLERKAIVLLDHAAPDLGHPSVCLATDGNHRLPALVMASVLARAGFHVVTPLLDLAALETVDLTQETAPALVIVVADSPTDRRIATFANLLSGQDVAVWTPAGDADKPASPLRRLPASPVEAAQALRRER